VKKLALLALILVSLSCSLWEYDDKSVPVGNQPPETYLSLLATDTIYALIDDIIIVTDTITGLTTYDTVMIYALIDEIIATTDSITGITTYDTTWNFSIGAGSSNEVTVHDSYENAFTTITTSQQLLNWWGEDQDGEVAGYFYKWNTDIEWSWTNDESGLFFIPIRTALDVFSFSVKAVDNSATWDYDKPAQSNYDEEYFSDIGDSINVFDINDSLLSEGATIGIQTPLDSVLIYLKGNDIYKLTPTDVTGAVDPTPTTHVFPIRNSNPEVEFRYGSNPLKSDHGNKSYTFPTRTFVWDAFDLDGRESITHFFYALDDTCDTCWIVLDAQIQSSVTLPDSFSVLTPGEHTFYLRARDIAGAESKIIQFPDSAQVDECQTWQVMPVIGNTLLVDDFPQDAGNEAQDWYSNVLDSVLGADQHSIWEVGDALPYSSIDVMANLFYFEHVVWFTAYTQIETYNEASSSILSFILEGGNFFISATELKDTSFVWFPIESRARINPNGRFLSGRRLESQVVGLDDLITSYTIGVRVRSFIPDVTQFEIIKDLFHLAEPGSGDEWSGTPNVCSLGQFEIPPNELSGKVVLMSLPLHNGSRALLEGDNGSARQLFNYLFTQEFNE